MAQSGSASGLGPEGRRFESYRSDHYLSVLEAPLDARIYKPNRSQMQAGRGKTQKWVLELLNQGKRTTDPLMGWTSIDDTAGQIVLEFDSRDSAIAYAKRQGLSFRVDEPREPKRLVKSYAQNFSADRKRPWTH